MIDAIDRALGELLEGVLADHEAVVVFDAPPDCSPTSGRNVVALFLHDIREDLAFRNGDWGDVRDDAGRVVGRQPPPRRYLLSYLVTAWCADVEREHALLGLVLAGLVAHPALPPALLHGRLAEQALPVVLQVAVPDLLPPASPDTWSAIGSPMRASLGLLVAAPLLPSVSTDLAPAAERLDLDMSRGGGGRTPAAAATGVGDLVTASAAAANAAVGDAPAGVAGRVVKRWSGFRVTERAGNEVPDGG